MKKYNYICSKCYVCKNLQDTSKNALIFPYCIKYGKGICNESNDEHLKLNEKNRPNMITYNA